MNFIESSKCSRTKTLRVLEVDYRTDPRWEEFVSSHPGALIYHHPGWLAALESEYGQKCVSLACEDEQGRIRAILPLLYTKGLPLQFGRVATGPRLSSLPRTPICGPLSYGEETAQAIVRYAVELVHSQRGVQLEIKSVSRDFGQSVSGLSCVPWRPTYVAELPPQVDGIAWGNSSESRRVPRSCRSCIGCRRLRFGNARRQHRVNWAVNKGIKFGIEVREAETEEELAEWYRLYLLTMRNNAVPPRPYRFFERLWSSLYSIGKMQLLLARQRQMGREKTVAGSILLKFGQTVFYAFTGCAPEDLPLHPHDILQLEAIRSACRNGYRWYDFGEVAEDHMSLAQFKSKWGGTPKPLFRHYSPAPTREQSGESSKLVSSARTLWRSLPPKVTEILGDWIYCWM
jgi:hypothetical protein